MYKKEKADAEKVKENKNTMEMVPIQIDSPLINKEDPLNTAVSLSPELLAIMKNEARHFPPARVINFLITLALLFTTSILIGNKY